MTHERTPISIAMAVYNGEKYIRTQIDSILVQLYDHDEIVISYDESSDNTLKIIKEYEEKDNRVRVVKNPSRGVVANFQNAVVETSNPIIFLSDQDDIWSDGKIDAVVEKFTDPNVTAVIHDTTSVDDEQNVICSSTFKARNGNTSLVKNLIRLSYIGCAMAFRSEMKEIVIPFPTKERSHDWWIGTMCCIFGRMEMINKTYILHRIHGGNVTPEKRPGIKYQIGIRYLIISNAIKRTKKHKNLLKMVRAGKPLCYK